MTTGRGVRLAVLLAVVLALFAGPATTTLASVPERELQALDIKNYLPFFTRSVSCSTGESYGTMNVPPPVTDRPAELHGDINLAQRGYSSTGGTVGLVSINGPTDGGAPQLDSLFSPDRLPTFRTNYRANHWLWPPQGAQPHGSRGTAITSPSVTVAGFQTLNPPERIHVPDSGYQIAANPTYHALVLYAAIDRITLKYTSEDNVVFGYALHIDNVCVDPALLALYQQMNTAGRDFLPALRHGQAVGMALTDEVIVAIRDTGAFMDPRSCKDWWKEYACP